MTCGSCGVANPDTEERCRACGALLPVLARAGGRSSPSGPPTAGGTQREVLSRYFGAAQRSAALERGAPVPPAPPDATPMQTRPRAWWDDQVRWLDGGPRARPGPPPPPPPRSVPPPPPIPARAPSPLVIASDPALPVVPVPPAIPAEAATARRGRALRAAPITALALLVVLVAVVTLILIPSPLRRATQTSENAPGTVAGGAPADAPAGPERPTQGPEPAAAGQVPAYEVLRGCGAACAASDQRAAALLVNRVNRARAGAGHAELVVDGALSLVAVTHVQEMIQRGRLSHTPTRLLGNRVTNWDVLAESIGVGPDVGALMDALMGSETDRTNLLDPTFRHVGVGAVRRGPRLWITLLFSDSEDPGTTLERP
jgi:uncharacterized protein YkwD